MYKGALPSSWNVRVPTPKYYIYVYLSRSFKILSKTQVSIYYIVIKNITMPYNKQCLTLAF